MIDSKEFFDNDVEKALTVLRSGGVILYPTDTIWGLGCDATNSEAVDKIGRIKKREGDKSLIILMTDERQIIKYVAAPDLAVFDFIEIQAEELTTDGTIGIRMVKDKFCRHLIRRLQKPIVSTSANISGQPSPSIFPEISDEIKNQVDYIVQWRQDDLNIVEPSQIIKWRIGGDYSVVRS
jgi:L-threonylcarbamoyladenylate synthase